jgi:hypothetical protein
MHAAHFICIYILKSLTWIFTKIGSVAHYMLSRRLNFGSYLPNVTSTSYTAPFIYNQSPKKVSQLKKKKFAHDTAYKFCY